MNPPSVLRPCALAGDGGGRTLVIVPEAQQLPMQSQDSCFWDGSFGSYLSYWCMSVLVRQGKISVGREGFRNKHEAFEAQNGYNLFDFARTRQACAFLFSCN